MPRETIILHSKREDPFARVPKTILDDTRLSWKAKGIMSYVLGKPQGWKVQVKDLCNRGTDGKDAVCAGLKELRTVGYASLEKIVEKGRIIEWVLKVSDIPNLLPETGFPDQEKPVQEKPVQENPPLSKNEGKKNEESKNDGNGASAPNVASSKPETKILAKAVVGYWNTKTELPSVRSVPPWRQRHLEARLKDPFWEENWKEAIDRIAASDFCLGKNDRKWKATFDFLLKPDTLTRTIEGAYDNRNGKRLAKEGDPW